ncbi:hypothetical protein BC834DRAFT_287268 [Gloeopeniophorella convolvens]|nr:hypothetical protein BC834DRAFT_287268 [Gloeopeniophorella convolvens]
MILLTPPGSRGTSPWNVERASSHVPPIHMLNNDVLLDIFRFYMARLYAGLPVPNGHRKWYKLAHVCRRWRTLILSSASHLDLCFTLTSQSLAKTLPTHLPPFPIDLDYECRHNLAAEGLDDSYDSMYAPHGKVLSLFQSHANRLRRISLSFLPISTLSKFISAMDRYYPLLKQLVLIPRTGGRPNLMLPVNFLTPGLRQLELVGISLPPVLQTPASAPDLVTLRLVNIPEYGNFPLNGIVEWLSVMPHLECLSISFSSANFRNIQEREAPRMTLNPLITLPNLQLLEFGGAWAYLDGLLARLDTPLLERFSVKLSHQLTFTFTSLSQFIYRTGRLKSRDKVKVTFLEEYVHVSQPTYLRVQEHSFHFDLTVYCRRLDWQVAAAAQIFPALKPILSTANHLDLWTLASERWLKEQDEADRSLWHQLLRPFTNLEVLAVKHGLLTDILRSLPRDDEDWSPDLLPQLRVLRANGEDQAFSSFMKACVRAGRHVRRQPELLPGADSLKSGYIMSKTCRRGAMMKTRQNHRPAQDVPQAQPTPELMTKATTSDLDVHTHSGPIRTSSPGHDLGASSCHSERR